MRLGLAQRLVTGIGCLWWKLGEKSHYLIIGGSVWAVGTLFLLFLVEVLQFETNFANALELLLTYQLNFIINDRLTFISTRVSSTSAYLRRGLKFNIVRSVLSFLEWLLMFSLNNFGLYYLVANNLSILLGTIFGYFAVKRWVFIPSL